MIKLSQPQMAAHLFKDWEETMIWSCLQGVMGKIYADDSVCPRCAMALLGDFGFLAGRPDEELLHFWKQQNPGAFCIFVPQNKNWEIKIRQVFSDAATRVTRYAIRKEPNGFDRRVLEKFSEALPSGYVLQNIEKPLFDQCRQNPWSRDLVSQYADYEAFERLGLGIVAVKDGRIVSGASAYSRYREGIEIEVDTAPAYRRKGLACSCSAKLILICLDRGLYPSWDAQNRSSVALAEKLGYHRRDPYFAYEVRNFAADGLESD